MAWYAKKTGAYARDSNEAISNAQAIYSLLFGRGWTLNAICGLLGNIHKESGYNPWRWQSDRVGASTGSPWTNKGYGLVQFTPAGKYINSARGYDGYGPNFSDKTGSPSDAYSQLVYVDTQEGYYQTSAYPLSYEEFKHSGQTPEYLASAFLYNYERPADPASTEGERREAARYWWNLLSGGLPEPDPGDPDPPVPPDPEPDPGPGPITGDRNRKLPIWMYIGRR